MEGGIGRKPPIAPSAPRNLDGWGEGIRLESTNSIEVGLGKATGDLLAENR
ncbi:MAG: hypothetical protein IPP58_15095 [Holophagaceae bacterium]|uniref:Uncharacterized protein n=1 Tax=Candidatus Geothrix skivensis TaxID=2954439 RepID=A0A9D7SHI2_9BACT|nr:hypothetical protein [Candidatus Geothrix skivensis]